MRKAREYSSLNHPEQKENKKVLIAALARVSGASSSQPVPEQANSGDSADYFTLTPEEVDALVNGNIGTIESWVSNLDKRLATRLFLWLMQTDC